MPDPTARAFGEWKGHPVLAVWLRLVVALLPLVAGIAVSVVLAHVLPPPIGFAAVAGWYVVLAAVMLVTTLATGREMQRFLPLAALLQLSLVFPDKAPSRFRVARRAGRPGELRSQLEEAQRRGATATATSMGTILELVTALSVHDKLTRGHSERVRVFADLLATEMGLSQEERIRLRWASLVHDIGKLEVPAKVLNSPASLDHEEWLVVQRHPAEGARLIEPVRQWLGDWARTVPEHHERWDGKGYPKGLRGRAISRGGRIVAVADAYEVMTAVRPYRRSIGVVAARQELVRGAGKQFDPAVVRAFLGISTGRLWRVVGFRGWLAGLPVLAPLGGAFSRGGGVGGWPAAALASLTTAAVVGAAAQAPTTPVSRVANTIHLPVVATSPGHDAPSVSPPVPPRQHAVAPLGTVSAARKPSTPARAEGTPASPPPKGGASPPAPPTPTPSPAPEPPTGLQLTVSALGVTVTVGAKVG